MGKIFIGLIFIFINFNLSFGAITIGLIPNFVGYIFMIIGLNELKNESDYFNKVRPFAIAMCIYNVITYAIDLFGISYSIMFLGIILGLISTAVSLYISYNIVSGVIDIENKRSVDINGSKLKSRWNLLAVFQVVCVLTLYIPFLSIVCMLIAVVFTIMFLVEYRKTKNMYECLPDLDYFSINNLE